MAVIAIGLCNSIMFPTNFGLVIEGPGLKAARGSGALCLALFVPAACYMYIAGYGWSARRPDRP